MPSLENNDELARILMDLNKLYNLTGDDGDDDIKYEAQCFIFGVQELIKMCRIKPRVVFTGLLILLYNIGKLVYEQDLEV